MKMRKKQIRSFQALKSIQALGDLSMVLSRIFFIFIFLFIAGCASHTPPAENSALLSAAQEKENLLKSFTKAGVQFIRVGDELRLILPENSFFIKDTARLKTTSDFILNEIVTLLNQQKNFGIHVLAYTPCLHCLREETCLAKQQAMIIAEYLLGHGLNTRLITATAWDGSYDNQYSSRSASFSGDRPRPFSVEIRTRYLQAEESE